MYQLRKNSCLPALIWLFAFTFQFIIHFQISGATSILETVSFPSTQGLTLPILTSPLTLLGSSAGDFNGDGYEDIFIASPGSTYNTLPKCGIVYVIFGTATGIPNIDPNTMAVTQGSKITGHINNSGLGNSVSALGDINGDSVDDIILGTKNINRAFVIFGKNNGQLLDIDLSTTDISATNQGIIIAFNEALTAVSSAGDFNGDGINDFMVSSSNQGEVYVIFGKNGISPRFDLDTMILTPFQGFLIIGITSSYLGRSLSKAGDVNKDGIDDIMIGTDVPAGGMVVIIYGTKTSTSTIQVDTLTSDQGIIVTGTSSNKIGAEGTIALAGDLNNDNIDDIALGAPTFGASPTNSGMIYIIYGKNGGFAGDIDLSSSFDGFQIKGEAQSMWKFGTSIAGTDLNGDGLSDLVIGCPGATSPAGTYSGITYVFFGNKNGFSNIDLVNQGSQLPQVLKIYGDAASQAIGSVVGSAKDLNKDGVNDLIILGNLKAYVIHGNQCESVIQCSSLSLSPICYASKGCACGEDNLFFQEKECVFQCSPGYYLSSPICETCPTDCSLCTSASTCQACIQGFVLKGTSCEPACPTGYHLEGSTCQTDDVSSLDEAKAISSITDKTQTTGSATLAAASLVAPSDPGSVTASTLAKMLQYIRYLDIPYSQRLELTFKNHNSTYGPYGVGPKISQEILIEMPFHQVPYRFIKYHVHSSFLINFWDSMIFLSIIFGMLFLAILTEWSVAKIKQKPVPYPIIQTVRAAIQNFFVMQFYNVFGDILLFLTLDLKKVMLINSEAVLSFCLSILFLFIGCGIVAWHIYILMRLLKLRKNNASTAKLEDFSKKYEGSTVLFIHFTETTFLGQSFLLIFVFRNCLFNLVICLLYDFPLIQAILILSMSAILLFYLLVQRPFKSVLNLLQHITCEIFMVIVNICVLTLAQINYEKEGSYQLRDRLCEVIIYSSLIFGFVPQVFLGLKIVVMAIYWYKGYRKKSYQENSGTTSQLKIKNRPQKGTRSSFNSQNKSLNDSSIGLKMVHNISNIILQDGDVSFTNTPTPKDFFKKNKQRIFRRDSKGSQEIKARDLTNLSKSTTSNQQWYAQQSDNNSSGLFEEQESNNVSIAVAKDVITAKTRDSNLPKWIIARKKDYS